MWGLAQKLIPMIGATVVLQGCAKEGVTHKDPFADVTLVTVSIVRPLTGTEIRSNLVGKSLGWRDRTIVGQVLFRPDGTTVISWPGAGSTGMWRKRRTDSVCGTEFGAARNSACWFDGSLMAATKRSRPPGGGVAICGS